VLHWQEQVRRYEGHELEDFPPRQKLRMIQNAVGDVTELETVKKLADLGVANGNRPLTYKSYVALLLEACSTFDKKRELPGRQRRAVYTATTTDRDPGYSCDQYYPYEYLGNGPYEAYQVDTDISDIMAHASESKRFGNRSGSGNAKSSRIPYPEWIKMTQEERDWVLAKRIQECQAKGVDNSKSYLPPQHADMHSVDSWVDLNYIIDYTVMKHNVDYSDPNDDEKVDEDGVTELLAYMAGQKSSCGVVC
jgi:hypothetical protein